ncbi:MAG: SRPBCC family protein [Proteobacteria bacterium]|nr:SRPBCC family protein [Pseudomonadota bacterium]
MRVIKYIFLALVFLVFLFFVVGYFLPEKVEINRSIKIDRPAKMVFKQINSMHHFNQWSPWGESDPNAKYTFSGPEYGVGSKMTWTGDMGAGSGSLEIIESVPNSLVKNMMHYEGQGDDPTWAILTISEHGESVIVDWTFKADFEFNITGRYFGLMLNDRLGPVYQQGLNNLKALVESMPVYDFSGLSIETVSPAVILYVSSYSARNDDYSSKLSESLVKIYNFMNTEGIIQTGMPLAIAKNRESGFSFDAGIPVEINSMDTASEIKLGSTYGGRVVKLIQQGSYSQASKSYELMDAFIEDENLEKAGNSWEVYVNDPANVIEADIITHIFQPIK